LDVFFPINHSRKIRHKDTKIELKVEKELKRRNINYQKQISLYPRAMVDFYLPEYRIVIQCDGDYWHNKKGRKENL
jgi:G:T-mismatch repair DNA endonuclease (very short patch repair protein)